MKEVLNFIIDNWYIILPIIEGLLRLVPTTKDVSIINNIIKLLNVIIPNIRKATGKEGIADFDEKGNALNSVKVRTDRFVKTVLLLFVFSISINVANAQIWQNFKGVRLVNVLDTTTVLPVSASIYYNQYTQRIMAYDTAWFNLRQSGSSGDGLTTASNGLTAVGSDVRLGGTSGEDIIISDVDGTHSFTIAGDGFFTNDYSNISLAAGSNLSLTSTSTVTLAAINNMSIQIGGNSGAINQALTSNGSGGVVWGDVVTSASNGLTATGSDVKLGGSLTENTTLNLGGHTLNMIGAGSSLVLNDGLDYFTVVDITTQSGTSVYGDISYGYFQNDVNGNQFFSGTNQPIRYAGDYSANFTGRSLVDKAYVDANAGITNTAANNELMKSNGTNAVPSGLFTTTNGDLTFGTGLTGATRTLSATGSASNVGFSLSTKGTGTVGITLGSADGYTFNPNSFTFTNSTGSTDQTITGANIGANGTRLIVRGNNGNSGGAGGAVLLRGGDGGTGNTNGGDITLQPGTLSGSGTNGSLIIETGTNATGTLKINSGSNEQCGTSTLVGGTVTVNNVKVTANSIIMLTCQTPGGTPGFLRISARVAGTSFTILSSSGTDTSVVGWLIIEPN